MPSNTTPKKNLQTPQTRNSSTHGTNTAPTTPQTSSYHRQNTFPKTSFRPDTLIRSHSTPESTPSHRDNEQNPHRTSPYIITETTPKNKTSMHTHSPQTHVLITRAQPTTTHHTDLALPPQYGNTPTHSHPALNTKLY